MNTQPVPGSLDVVGFGHAIVDVIAPVEDDFISAHGLVKGTMALIDEAQAHRLYGAMPSALEVSGGSSANTMAGIASLGGSVAYVGTVAADSLGEVFAHDIRAIGVYFRTEPAIDSEATARSLIVVTPDAERTMNTYLGASRHLSIENVDVELIARAAYVYFEAYLWDVERTKTAIRHAIQVARSHQTKVVLSLSDPMCVDRWQEELHQLVREGVDVLLGNADEYMRLFEVDTVEAAVDAAHQVCETVVCTQGAKGAMVCDDQGCSTVSAEPVADVVDTTGAGDLFAAGFVWGLARGFDLARCAEVGAICAAEVIGHYGARPQTDLGELVAARVAR